MGIPLAVLLVEDMESDAQLVLHTLKKAGYETTSEQVETAEQMRAALKKQSWDIVISDYSLPQFNGRAALSLLQETGFDIPFIAVSGTIGEETAVEMMKVGAHDYLMKGNLTRLSSAIERELAQAKVRRERKQADIALMESSARFRTLFESSPDAIILIDPNGNWPILDCNMAACQMNGYTRDELIGQSIDILNSTPSPSAEHVDYLERVRHTDVWRYETFHRHKDGRVFPVEVSTSLITLGNREVILGIDRDVTERKRAEAARIAAEAELRALFASMTDVVFVLDLQGVYRKIAPTNPALLYAPPEELLGKSVIEIFSDKQAQYFLKVLRQVLNTGQTLQIEYQLTYDQRTPWFEAAVSPITADSTLWVVRDVTERKQAEEIMRQRLNNLEVLYESGVAISQWLPPKEIAEKIIGLLQQKMDWHHVTICLYHPEDETLELLAFIQSGVSSETERQSVEMRFKTGVTHAGQGLSGWAIQHRQNIRTSNLQNDPRYIEVFPGLHSGLYVLIQSGDRLIGVISIESEKVDAFSESDERLTETLATQAAITFENSRLFEETRHRVSELEAINTISSALRSAQTLNEILPRFLSETLAILHTPDGALWLYDDPTDILKPVTAQGWLIQRSAKVIKRGVGIIGNTFVSGKPHLSLEFGIEQLGFSEVNPHFPQQCGGVTIPIRTSQEIVGVLLVSVELPRQIIPAEVQLLNTLAEMAGNTIHRMSLHEQTASRLQRLAALRSIDIAISSNFELPTTLGIILDQVESELSVDAVSILLYNSTTQTLTRTAQRGFRYKPTANLSVMENTTNKVALEQRTISETDPQQLSAFESEGFVAYYGTPLITKGELKGILEVFHRQPFKANEEWLDFFETLGGQTAIAVDHLSLFQSLQLSNFDLQLAYDTTLEGWSRALDLRDKETEGHTQRVTTLTLHLARTMNIPEVDLLPLQRGALLHDIGKMGIPDAILLKPSALTDEEWVIMRRHPQYAYDLLLPIPYLRSALDIPYCHHEKWDGTGYPRGLQGEHIPLAARIFALADVWDALRSNRPYRAGWSAEKAREHIKSLSGTHFDPAIVEVFLNLPNATTASDAYDCQ